MTLKNSVEIFKINPFLKYIVLLLIFVFLFIPVLSLLFGVIPFFKSSILLKIFPNLINLSQLLFAMGFPIGLLGLPLLFYYYFEFSIQKVEVFPERGLTILKRGKEIYISWNQIESLHLKSRKTKIYDVWGTTHYKNINTLILRASNKQTFKFNSYSIQNFDKLINILRRIYEKLPNRSLIDSNIC